MRRSLSVCTKPKVEKIIHISISIAARGMKFGQNMDVTKSLLTPCIWLINRHGAIAMTGRAHCQRQVAFLSFSCSITS